MVIASIVKVLLSLLLFFSKIFMILLKIDLDNLFQLCLSQAMQMITKLNKMVEAGMAEKVNVVVMMVMILMMILMIARGFNLKMFQSWAANIIKSKFEDPIPSEDLKDHFMRGEWEVPIFSFQSKHFKCIYFTLFSLFSLFSFPFVEANLLSFFSILF